MANPLLPPHLKVSETVTDQEYATAKSQSRIILISAIGLSGVVLVVTILFFTGLNISGALIGLLAGTVAGVGCERIMNQLMPEGQKMKTRRMKVYPELRDWRRRQSRE
jgi:hypothetical protein